MNLKCRDLSCKIKTGFNNSKVMRSNKQKKKLASHPKKCKWEEEAQEEINAFDKESDPSQYPWIEVDGESFVDIEKVLADPKFHTTSGRPMYVPGKWIPVRKYNPAIHDVEYPSWIAYGKRRTGKTFFMNWWLWHHRNDYDQIYVFSETLINGFWHKRVPRQAAYPEWDEGRAAQILEFQKWVIENPREAAQKGYTDKTCVILDDVIASKVLRSAGDDGNFAGLYVQGRHTHMTVGTATQKATALPPKVRDNIDIVFIMRQENYTEIERIWKEHMSRLNKVTAMQMMDYWTRTENYKTPEEVRYTLVIDTDPCLSYNERFYYAIAEDVGEFQIGSKVFWEEMDY